MTLFHEKIKKDISNVGILFCEDCGKPICSYEIQVTTDFLHLRTKCFKCENDESDLTRYMNDDERKIVYEEGEKMNKNE